VHSQQQHARVAGEEIATLKGHTGMVYSVAFNQKGTLLASGNGTVRLSDIPAVKKD
jgi:hypothetical protein